jgi:hypothetical protein
MRGLEILMNSSEQRKGEDKPQDKKNSKTVYFVKIPVVEEVLLPSLNYFSKKLFFFFKSFQN